MGKKESYEDFLLSEKSFCGFLIRQREEKRVTLDRLAEGLCEASHLARIEKGDTEDAKRLLEDYSACVCENDRLRMQFILTGQALKLAVRIPSVYFIGTQ